MAVHIGAFAGGVRYTAVGAGSRPVVVINGGNGFVRRFTPERAIRNATRMARCFPADARLYLLEYDATAAERYSIESHAHEVAAMIRTEFAAVTVAGVSFGAFVALRVAAEAPDAVRDLIVLVGAHRFSDEGRQRVGRQIADASRGDLVAMTRPFLTLFRRPWLNALMALGAWSRRGSLPQSMNPPETIVRMLRAALEEDACADRKRLRQITARTLVLGGTADQFFDFGAFRETADAIPAARLQLFPRETHMLPLERPRAVAAAIASFLTPTPPRTPSMTHHPADVTE